MAIRKVVVFPDERLRKPTKEIVEFNDELRALVADMFETMYDDDGIGLAAPQIGVSKKIVVIDIKDSEDPSVRFGPYVLINPKITAKEGTAVYTEGCLSVPEIYEDITRAEKVTLEAYNEFGELKTYHADGLLAICMQHELDHLEGRLFIDYLSPFKRERVLKAIKRKNKAGKNKN